MTGLEKIISKINADSETKNNAMISEAEKQCEKMLDAAKASGEKLAAEIEADAAKQCENIIAMAKSGAAQRTRQKVLAAKVEVIDQTLQKLHEALCGLPEKEYFEAVIKLASDNCMAGKCEARLNKADNERMPEWFAEKLVKALSEKNAECVVSKEIANIESGVVLVYGDIDINCSFKAIIDADSDDLKAKISEIIF